MQLSFDRSEERRSWDTTMGITNLDSYWELLELPVCSCFCAVRSQRRSTSSCLSVSNGFRRRWTNWKRVGVTVTLWAESWTEPSCRSGRRWSHVLLWLLGLLTVGFPGINWNSLRMSHFSIPFSWLRVARMILTMWCVCFCRRPSCAAQWRSYFRRSLGGCRRRSGCRARSLLWSRSWSWRRSSTVKRYTSSTSTSTSTWHQRREYTLLSPRDICHTLEGVHCVVAAAQTNSKYTYKQLDYINNS